MIRESDKLLPSKVIFLKKGEALDQTDGTKRLRHNTYYKFGFFFLGGGTILFSRIIALKVRMAAKIRNRYNQVLHVTQDTTWKSDKNTIKHHEQEPRGQPSPFR